METLAIVGGRPPNEVDILLNRVKEIQSKCQHRYKIGDPDLKLKPSLVADIYSASDDQGHFFKITYKCNLCSDYKISSTASTCVKCLGEMKIVQRGEEVSKYYPYEARSLEAIISACSQCGFKVVHAQLSR